MLVLFLSITDPRNSKAAEVSLVWMAEPHPSSTLFHIPLLYSFCNWFQITSAKHYWEARGRSLICYLNQLQSAVPKQNLVKVTSVSICRAINLIAVLAASICILLHWHLFWSSPQGQSFRSHQHLSLVCPSEQLKTDYNEVTNIMEDSHQLHPEIA